MKIITPGVDPDHTPHKHFNDQIYSYKCKCGCEFECFSHEVEQYKDPTVYREWDARHVCPTCGLTCDVPWHSCKPVPRSDIITDRLLFRNNDSCLKTVGVLDDLFARGLGVFHDDDTFTGGIIVSENPMLALLLDEKIRAEVCKATATGIDGTKYGLLVNIGDKPEDGVVVQVMKADYLKNTEQLLTEKFQYEIPR
jgi:hypothetical protein